MNAPEKHEPSGWCGQYILDGHTPVPEYDTITWAMWFEKADRRVAIDMVKRCRISTVFLGLDHNHSGGEPILFETMIFGGLWDKGGEYQTRCCTWGEAEEMHRVAIVAVTEEFHKRLILWKRAVSYISLIAAVYYLT